MIQHYSAELMTHAGATCSSSAIWPYVITIHIVVSTLLMYVTIFHGHELSKKSGRIKGLVITGGWTMFGLFSLIAIALGW